MKQIPGRAAQASAVSRAIPAGRWMDIAIRLVDASARPATDVASRCEVQS